MTDEEYAATPGVNWSSLKYLDVSPRLFRYRQQHPPKQKPSFVFGGAVHCAILEPQHFDARYAPWLGKTRRGEEWNAWKAANPGKQSLTPSELERVNGIAKAVLEDPSAGPLIKGGRREEVVTWTDTETGLKCKGRMDYIRPDFLLDLKSTRDPEALKFGRSAGDYGYHGQTAFYNDGAVAARLISGRDWPRIIAVKTTDDFDVAVYEVDPPALNAGRQLYRRLLRLLVTCIETNCWPGVSPVPQALVLPPWHDGKLIAEEKEEEF